LYIMTRSWLARLFFYKVWKASQSVHIYSFYKRMLSSVTWLMESGFHKWKSGKLILTCRQEENAKMLYSTFGKEWRHAIHNKPCWSLLKSCLGCFRFLQWIIPIAVTYIVSKFTNTIFLVPFCIIKTRCR